MKVYIVVKLQFHTCLVQPFIAYSSYDAAYEAMQANYGPIVNGRNPHGDYFQVESLDVVKA